MSQKDVLSAYSPHFHGQSLSAPHCHSQVLFEETTKSPLNLEMLSSKRKYWIIMIEISK